MAAQIIRHRHIPHLPIPHYDAIEMLTIAAGVFLIVLMASVF
jgi:hypothetical protein